MNIDWPAENVWEKEWWGTCQNTYGEEIKQLTYAKYMGLSLSTNPNGSPCIDAGGKSILDIGGGPVSMLLKCFNLRHGAIIDPCPYPGWVFSRYLEAKIVAIRNKAEEVLPFMPANSFDEVWIYNCLQHVDDPRVILRWAKRLAPVLRIFEWVHVGTSPGHPHDLSKHLFDMELGPGGFVLPIKEVWSPGSAYFSVFEWGRDSYV